jgi:transglutaminase-like putative cysteine protease
VNRRFTVTAAVASAAASTALLPLISGGKWFFGGLGGIIVVALVGTATRHRALRALPAVVCLLCALAALAIYLNLIYAASYSYIHLVPSPRSLSHLWHSAVTALRATKSQTPPVPGSVGIELVAGAGIGLVAALTDLIAVRLRRCALAGLPLLVLFSVPIATDTGGNTTENTIVFCLGIAGYLALLSTDGRERLRLWGRLVTPWNANHPDEPVEELGAGPSLRALSASGRRIGLAAVALALFAPLLIPGLHAQKLFSGSGDGHGHGSGHGSELSVNPVAEMTGDLRQNPSEDLFTYTTDDPHPQYLVEEVLGKLTDTGAVTAPLGPSSPLRPGQSLPPVPGLVSGNWPPEHTEVTMAAAETLSDGYLPVPYAPRQVTVSRSAVMVNPRTLMVSTPLRSLTDLKYLVTSEDVSPTPAQYAAASATPIGMGYYLEVPSALRSLGPLARRIVGGASTPFGKVEALEKWFQTPGRFAYDVTQSLPDNAHALYDFLTKTRTGYCQQFSFAMTVLARLLGIPARVAVGFDRGRKTSAGHYRVDGSDAHAWTQLYFTGLGWTTWDPTPPGNGIGQTNLVPPVYSTSTGGRGTTSGGQAATPGNHSVSAGYRENIRQRLLGELNGHGGGSGALPPTSASSKPASGLPIVLIVLGALLVAGLVAPRTVRSVTRRRRWLTARTDISLAHTAWAELLDSLVDYNLGHGPGETPRAVARRIGTQQHLDTHTREALNRLAQAEERASYAPQPIPGASLAADVATVRGGLAASAPRAIRWRARLMPASSAEVIRRVTSHALDAFGWLEVAITRLRSRLPASRRPRPET